MLKQRFKSYYHSANKKIRKNKVLLKINILFVPILKYFYFSNERLLVKGKNISKSNHKSILFFTSQKCASTFLSGIFEKLVTKDKMEIVRFSNYFRDVDRSPMFKNKEFLNNAFKTKGYYYGAFRAFHHIPNIEDYHVVLVLRDPRDVLTSSYFSTSFNHPISRKDTLEKRKYAQQQSIDEYVKENYIIYKKIYGTYCDKLVNNNNILFLRYEDMIEDFEPWLNKLLSHCNLDHHNEAIEEIIQNTSFEVEENKNNFKRNVKAGDHLNKLEQETIDFLNRELGPILDTLGYK